MAAIDFQRMDSVSGLIDPTSKPFSTAFAHLVAGVLRRQHSIEEVRQRALSEMWNWARLAARSLEAWDESGLRDEMVIVFVRRLFDGTMLANFDPATGTIEGFLLSRMRFIARECLRARARRRMEARSDQSLISSIEPGPAAIAEQKDLVEHIRLRAADLPPKERDAVARRYTALAHLDSGAPIRNECVVRHRGLKRLRKMAGQSDAAGRPAVKKQRQLSYG